MNNVPEPRQASPCRHCWGNHPDESCPNQDKVYIYCYCCSRPEEIHNPEAIDLDSALFADIASDHVCDKCYYGGEND